MALSIVVFERLQFRHKKGGGRRGSLLPWLLDREDGTPFKGGTSGGMDHSDPYGRREMNKWGRI